MTTELETEIQKRMSKLRKDELQSFNYNSIDYIAYENTMIPITKEIKNLIAFKQKSLKSLVICAVYIQQKVNIQQ